MKGERQMAELLLEIAPRAKGEIISISIVSPGSLIRRARRLAPNRCGRMTWHEAVSIIARTYWPYAYEVHAASKITYADSLFPISVREAAHELAYRYEIDKTAPKSVELRGDYLAGWV